VSLILEALKKLDREKQAPDRGVVIVGPSAWPSPREGLFALRGGGLVLAAVLVGGAAGAAWLLRARHAEPPAPPAVASAPAQPAQAALPPDARPPLSAAMPGKGPRAGVAARPKARPEPTTAGTGTDVAPAPPAAATDSAPAATTVPEGAPAETAPMETAPAETPRSRSASRRSGPVDFELQAISAQNGQPVAMLNDRLVHEGDTFDNVKVVRIGTDEVEIEVAGHRRVVKF